MISATHNGPHMLIELAADRGLVDSELLDQAIGQLFDHTVPHEMQLSIRVVGDGPANGRQPASLLWGRAQPP